MKLLPLYHCLLTVVGYKFTAAESTKYIKDPTRGRLLLHRSPPPSHTLADKNEKPTMTISLAGNVGQYLIGIPLKEEW